MSEERWLTTADVAKLTGFKRPTITKNANLGLIPGYRFCSGVSGWRFKESEIRKWIETGRRGPRVD